MLKKVILTILIFAAMPMGGLAADVWETIYKDEDTVVSLNTVTARYFETRDVATADVRAKDKKGKEDLLLSYEINYQNAKIRLVEVKDLNNDKEKDIYERSEKDWHSPFGIEMEIFQYVAKEVDRDKKIKEQKSIGRSATRNTQDDIQDGIYLANTIDNGIRTIERVLRR